MITTFSSDHHHLAISPSPLLKSHTLTMDSFHLYKLYIHHSYFPCIIYYSYFPASSKTPLHFLLLSHSFSKFLLNRIHNFVFSPIMYSCVTIPPLITTIHPFSLLCPFPLLPTVMNFDIITGIAAFVITNLESVTVIFMHLL